MSHAQQKSVAQTYTYEVKDQAAFVEGYREHLRWHDQVKDSLVWYGWTVVTGPRKGYFVDGTFGTTFAELDGRPDLKGDAAHFVRYVAPHVRAVDIETWELIGGASNAKPLEERSPSASVDAFTFVIAPEQATTFRRLVERLEPLGAAKARLSWYRGVRVHKGDQYLMLLSRKNLADIEAAGGSLPSMLTSVYGSVRADEVLRAAVSYTMETWAYEPRLSLIPGQPLAD
jgi:hypothetical protein